MQVTVIGLGHPLRRDDALGLVLTERLQRRGVPQGVRLLTAGDNIWSSAAVMSAATPSDAIILVDAVRLGDAPGTLHRFTDLPFPSDRPLNQHDANPADLLSMGKPGALAILGLEPADLSYGIGLSSRIRRKLALLESVVRTFMVEFLERESAKGDLHCLESAFRNWP